MVATPPTPREIAAITTAVKRGRASSMRIVRRRSVTSVSPNGRRVVSLERPSRRSRHAADAMPVIVRIQSRSSCRWTAGRGRSPLIREQPAHLRAIRVAKRARKEPQQQVEEHHDVHRFTV